MRQVFDPMKNLTEYRILPMNEFPSDKFELVTLREEDIFQIKEWRNEQMVFLRQGRLLTDLDQKNYFETVVRQSFHAKQPDIILFSYLEEGICIGYGGFVHIDWESKRAEVSFLMATEKTKSHAVYQAYFRDFLSIIKRIAFDVLGFNRIFTETFNTRSHHVKVLEESEFKFEGCMRQHVRIGGHYCDSLIHGCLKEEGSGV